jgi:hypothetical protein
LGKNKSTGSMIESQEAFVSGLPQDTIEKILQDPGPSISGEGRRQRDLPKDQSSMSHPTTALNTRSSGERLGQRLKFHEKADLDDYWEGDPNGVAEAQKPARLWANFEKLQYAVLMDAVSQLDAVVESKRREALEWIARSEDQDHIFSFEACCHTFGLIPTAVRETLLKREPCLHRDRMHRRGIQ